VGPFRLGVTEFGVKFAIIGFVDKVLCGIIYCQVLIKLSLPLNIIIQTLPLCKHCLLPITDSNQSQTGLTFGAIRQSYSQKNASFHCFPRETFLLMFFCYASTFLLCASLAILCPILLSESTLLLCTFLAVPLVNALPILGTMTYIANFSMKHDQ